jgi:site-specific recombinase XerC
LSSPTHRHAPTAASHPFLHHANIATTQRYAHLSRDRLMEAASKAGAHYHLAFS